MSTKLKAILLSLLATLAMNSIATPSGKTTWNSDKPTIHTVKVKNIYTNKELLSLFKKYDYYAVNLIDKNTIHIVINNQNYAFYNYSQDNNKLYIVRYFDNDLKVGLDTLNEWNMQNIFKGYIENDIVVFSFMLDTEYGVSEEQIIELLRIGEDATAQLSQFIRDKQNK